MAVPPGAISKVEVVQKKGLFLLSSTSAVTVIYQNDNKPKRTTWPVPKEMVDDGNPVIFMVAKAPR